MPRCTRPRSCRPTNDGASDSSALERHQVRISIVLPNLIAPNLRILFTGTAVGSASARAGAYYAGPGNAFWPTLHTLGLTPRRLEPSEYRTLLELSLA